MIPHLPELKNKEQDGKQKLLIKIKEKLSAKRQCLGLLLSFVICLVLVVLVFALGIMFGTQLADFNRRNSQNPELHRKPQAEALKQNFRPSVKVLSFKSLNQSDETNETYYSATIDPISANFAKPTILEKHEQPKSLLDRYRKIEIQVRLTLQELISQMTQWRENIFTCKYVLSQICAPESAKSKLKIELDRFNKFKQIFWSATHSTDKINQTQIYRTIEEAKSFMTQIETSKVDLCGTNSSGDDDDADECRQCLKRKADDYYTNGLWCKTYREWHIIRYKPKEVRLCS